MPAAWRHGLPDLSETDPHHAAIHPIMKTSFEKLAHLAFALTIPATSHAANLAFDNASSSAYDFGWTDGSNGGSGWGPWSLAVEGIDAGFFLGGSVTNGDGLDDGFVGGVAGDNDIDTTLGSGPGGVIHVTTPVSFGMYAGDNSRVGAIRGMTGGALGIGQTITMDFDNGFMDAGANFGIGLLNADGDPLWELRYESFDGVYSYVDDTSGFGPNPTSVAPGTEGLRLAFELLAPDVYSMSLERRDGQVFDLDFGFLISDDDQDITQIGIYLEGNLLGLPSDPSGDFFINSMAVVPEPSAMLLAFGGSLGLLLRRRRSRA